MAQHQVYIGPYLIDLALKGDDQLTLKVYDRDALKRGVEPGVACVRTLQLNGFVLLGSTEEVA